MAYEYKNLPVLSKVKIGEQVYYLKDAELRALVDTFGDAVKYNVDAEKVTVDGNLATVKAMKAYIEEQVAGLTGAMHFVGVVEELPETGANGDVVIVGTAEYVYSDGWKLIGDEGVYATNAGVEAAYVKKTLTIAGIDHADDITAEELIAALGLKALAFKDNASTTLTDYATGIEGTAYTPAGQVGVELGHTSTAIGSTGTYTPAGGVSGTTTAAGTVAIARDEAGTAITGTVSAPNVTITPTTATVQHIETLGQLPSYTAATYVAPKVAEAKAQFAADGIVATVGDGEDTEILVFSAATKADALTTTGFDAGSYTPAEFNAGALPTLGAEQTVVTGVSATADAPIFTGDKFGATFTGTEAAINATFAGTEGAVNVTGNYDKATSATGAFTGTEATIAPTLTKGTKQITVQ